MRYVAFTLAAFFFAGVSPQAKAAGLAKSTPALVEKGKEAYKTNCVSCHGDKGDGNGVAGAMMNPKPRDFKHSQFKNGDKPEQIFKTLTDGLEGTAMASFRHLSDEERSALVYYVLSLRK